MQFYTLTIFMVLVSVSAGLLAAAGVFPDTFVFQQDTELYNTIEEQIIASNLSSGSPIQPGQSPGFAEALGSILTAGSIFTTVFVQAVLVIPLLFSFGIPPDMAAIIAIPIWLVYFATMVQFFKGFRQFR